MDASMGGRIGPSPPLGKNQRFFPYKTTNFNPSKKILNPLRNFFHSLEETSSPSHMRNLNFHDNFLIPFPKKVS